MSEVPIPDQEPDSEQAAVPDPTHPSPDPPPFEFPKRPAIDPGNPLLGQPGSTPLPEHLPPSMALPEGDAPYWTPRPEASMMAGGPAPEATPAYAVPGPHYFPPPGGYGPYGTVAAPAPRRRVIGRVGRVARELAETIVLALFIFLLVRAVEQNFQVEGRSMEPSFQTGWYLLVNKAMYWEVNLETIHKYVPFVDPGDDPTRYLFRGPKRGDVIVFKDPGVGPNEPERDFIKRIIGLPGETVEVRDCTVFVNGEALAEPYIKERPNYSFGPETVPVDHYFVLGDNRNNSSDSHSWGMLPKGNIIGRAWLIYWPFKHFGFVDSTSVEPGAPADASRPPPEPSFACS
jgi:signal peptidase I